MMKLKETVEKNHEFLLQSLQAMERKISSLDDWTIGNKRTETIRYPDGKSVSPFIDRKSLSVQIDELSEKFDMLIGYLDLEVEVCKPSKRFRKRNNDKDE